MAESAAGIPDRSDRSDHTRLQPGQLVDWLVSLHDAERAGRHRDVRLGTPDTGLLSWATKKELPKPGEQIVLHGQPVHAHGYLNFQGEHQHGYGKGRVAHEDLGKALITAVGPNKLDLAVAHRKHPVRYQLIRPPGWEPTQWLTRNVTPRPEDKPPYVKVHYGRIPVDQAERHLAGLGPDDVVQPKIDGASTLVTIPKNKQLELYSYREQRANGQPISHVEKAYGTSAEPRPKLTSLPAHLADSVLRGELYAKDRSGRALPPQALGAILNSSLANALDKQRDQGLGLHAALFDIQRRGGRDVPFDTVPYQDRRRMLEEFLPHLPGNFHLVPQVSGGAEAAELWRRIGQGQHPLTREGVVVHPQTGKPFKAKHDQEFDVVVRAPFAGRGKYKGSVGGLTYAHPEAPEQPAGRIGSGFSDEARRMIADNPQDWVGRIARVRAHERLPSGALRMPVFLGLHEDQNAKSKEANVMSLGHTLGRLAAEQVKTAHKLTTEERRETPKSELGNPSKPATESGSYPMPDAAHARIAVGLAAMHHPHSALLARIRAKAHRLYPGAGSSKAAGEALTMGARLARCKKS